MLRDFTVVLQRGPGPIMRDSDPATYTSFWIQMKASFDLQEEETFDYQIQQKVLYTRVGTFPPGFAPPNDAPWEQVVWHPRLERMTRDEGHNITDVASALQGWRKHRKSNAWYTYTDKGFLEKSDPPGEVNVWDIWLEDEPSYDNWHEGQYALYQFTAICEVVKVRKVLHAVVLAQIGPYSLRWCGISPKRRTNVPKEGKTLRWDERQLRLPQVGHLKPYEDNFLMQEKGKRPE